MNQANDERGAAGINFLWPDISHENFEAVLSLADDELAYNNLSPIFTYSLNNGIKAIWLGDMEHDFLEKIGYSHHLYRRIAI